jgi:hypothetical protein
MNEIQQKYTNHTKNAPNPPRSGHCRLRSNRSGHCRPRSVKIQQIQMAGDDGGRRGRRWLTIFQLRLRSSGTAVIVGDGGAVVVGDGGAVVVEPLAPAGTTAPICLQQRRPSGPGKETRRRRPWGRRRGAPAVGGEARLGRATGS